MTELHCRQSGTNKNYAGIFLLLTHGLGGLTLKAKFSLTKEGLDPITFTLAPSLYGYLTDDDEDAEENGTEMFKRGTCRFTTLDELSNYVHDNNSLKFKIQIALENPRLQDSFFNSI